MKRLKSKITILVALIFSFVIFSCDRDDDFPIYESPSEQINGIVLDQEEACQNYSDLLNWMNLSTRSGISGYFYPEYYGGAYINEENRLVVKIRQEPNYTRAIADLSAYLGKNVVYEPCNYSYNYLQAESNSITAKIKRHPNLCKNIALYGVDEKQNRIVVYLYDSSQDNTNLLKEQFDISDSIVIIKQCIDIVDGTQDSRIVNPGEVLPPYNIALHDTLLCGEGFLNYIPNIDTIAKRASIGYRARIKDTDTVGFVTAAHTFYRGKGNVVPFILNMEDKKVIASCDRNRILYDEIIDAAFCIPVHSGIHISNFVKEWYQYPNTTLSTDTITPSIGMWVNMVGCSSGLVAGQILNPSLNHPISNDTTLNIIDVVITNIQGATGDSGGLVFHTRSKNMNLPNPYKPYTLGIHKGMLTTKTISGNDTTITREAMCIKATLINRILGLELY